MNLKKLLPLLTDNSEQSFDEVYEGFYDDQLVAVKIIANTPETTKTVAREKEAARTNKSNSGVIEILRIETDSQYHYVAYENCLMSLAHFIDLKNSEENPETFAELEKIDMKKILLDAAKGLKRFHKTSPNFAHRNIRPHNILIINQDNGFIGKLSNLAFSKRFELGRDTQSVSGSFNPQKVTDLLLIHKMGLLFSCSCFKGWCAPEIINLDDEPVQTLTPCSDPVCDPVCSDSKNR